MLRRAPWLGGRVGIAACGLLASLAISACGRSPVAEPPRILLIGLDGADLRMVDRLAADGRVPSLARLAREGVSAPLETVSNASPVVWTSIATGVMPEKHGIRAFVQHGQPVASTMRRRPAFWNILSHYGHSVGVLAWWATFPAERVLGYVVSPYVVFRPPSPGKAHVENLWRGDGLRRTYPTALYARIAPSMQAAKDVDRTEIRDVYADDVRTTQTPWSVARDRSYGEIARRMMETLPVETLAVYFQGIDVASHDLSRELYGRNVNRRREPRVGPDEVRAAKQRVDAMYDRVDAIVGDLLECLSDGTDVIVVSDHGWDTTGRVT
jgi:predicted AlkP superfamily phosphohydrolase/phosphomutase